LRKKQTPEEEAVWFLLRDNKLGIKWRRQVSIGPYIADFYCRKKQLALEIDGIQHAEHTEYDADREKYFLSIGIRTLRFWNHEILSSIDEVEKLILETMKCKPCQDDLKVKYF